MSKVFYRGSLVYLETDDGQRFVYDERRGPLGSGAMGDVFQGVVYGTDTRVAVKKIKDRYANNPEIRRRAKLEASLMFRHRNLIEMLGCCELEPDNGPLYIISNFVRGENIDKFIQKNLPKQDNSVKKICELIFPVFDALSYIHSHKIWHMDIKPSNIMVEHGSNVRLMDLGIVQVDQTMSSSKSGLMGTPGYAAPEQFCSRDSNQGKIDGRTDLYELGVTIYELLTGKNPFDSSSLAESKQLHSTLVLPYCKNVPNEVIDVLRKATHPNATERYATASAMKYALQIAVNKKRGTDHTLQIILAVCCTIVVLSVFILMVFINA